MNPEDIFNKAVEITDPTEQTAFLDQVCAGDEKLRTEVDALLKWNQEAGSFLDVADADLNATLDGAAVPDASGTVIGRYKLLEKIGEGGMATVYLAEQKHPIRRRVALKIIKLGMDTKQVIGRFEAERQALAMMDHPNIAKVFDAGTTDTGRPYFVMELVKGLPMTKFCDSNHLTTQERLELFIAVCQAVQHAHQRGIIHRDIKPFNVLVTLHDGNPVVKVIDFGIAKAVNQQLTEKTVFTRFSQMIGTPEYMSPEQAEMSGLDIDTRTDVFSLGVLLYELLTGTTPFESEYLLSKGYNEMQRIIREEEPVRPSTKVSTLGDTLTEVAKYRRTNPEVLCKLIRSDLDWIVMKTLEKDRQRRYESVSELTADVQRHLDNETVLAGRPSSMYRLQKFVKRNKGLVSAMSAIAVIVIIAAIVSTTLAITTMKARTEAEKAANAESVQRQQKADALQLALEERDRAQTNLYDSLIAGIRAIRTAREPGYRETVFESIQHARQLDVPQMNLSDLRTEAVACMGDFFSHSPSQVLDIPDDPNSPSIRVANLHPTEPTVAFSLSDGTILLKDFLSNTTTFKFNGEHPSHALCFARTGHMLLSLHIPKAQTPEDDTSLKAVARLFVRASDGTWLHDRDISIPNARQCMSAGNSFYVSVAKENGYSFQIKDVISGGIIHQYQSEKQMQGWPLISMDANGSHLAAVTYLPGTPRKYEIHIWNIKSNTHITTFTPSLADCTGIKFSDEGHQLSVLSQSGGIIYSLPDFKPIGQLNAYLDSSNNVTFIPNTNLIAFTAAQRLVHLWDWKSKEYKATLGKEFGRGWWLSTSANGRSLLSFNSKQAWLYILEAKDEKKIMSSHSSGAPGIDFSPDGHHLASVDKKNRLRIWHCATGTIEWERDLEGVGQCVSYSSDGKWIVTTDYDHERAWIWNSQTRKQAFCIDTNQVGRTWDAVFTQDDHHLLTGTCKGGEDVGSLKVWDCSKIGDAGDTSPKATIDLVQTLSGNCQGLVAAPNGSFFAFVDPVGDPKNPKKLYLWQWSKSTGSILLANDAMGVSQMLSFTPDSKHLIYVDPNRSVVTLSVPTGKIITSFPTILNDHADDWSRYIHLSLSPDGELLAMSSLLNLGISIWSLDSGSLLYSLPEQPGRLYCLDWSPNGNRLAASYSHGKIEIWNLKKVERVLTDLMLWPPPL